MGQGHKFDLRIYAAVTCLNPLRVYVHEQGGCLCGRRSQALPYSRLAVRACGAAKQALAPVAAPAICVSGLVRFATKKYSNRPASFQHRRSHLCNVALNRGHASPEAPGQGPSGSGGSGGTAGKQGAVPKWSLSDLRLHLESEGLDWQTVWEQVRTWGGVRRGRNPSRPRQPRRLPSPDCR